MEKDPTLVHVNPTCSYPNLKCQPSSLPYPPEGGKEEKFRLQLPEQSIERVGNEARHGTATKPCNVMHSSHTMAVKFPTICPSKYFQVYSVFAGNIRLKLSKDDK